MLHTPTQASTYWTTHFKITRADIEFLFSQFLEEEAPLTIDDLARRLIRYRLRQEQETLRRQIARGELFQPKGSYQIGQELVFPAFNFAIGKVVGQRAGENVEYGEFSVIEVEFENKERHEFASMLEKPHALNVDEAGGQQFPSDNPPDPDAIFEQYGETIVEEIEATLVDQQDAIFFAGQWFLRSLMLDVNVGHMHLAEAMLDINEGGPLDALTIAKEIDLGKGVEPPLVQFSLDVSMSNDERFDDVGATGQVQWFLKRLEPPEVHKTPTRLFYQPIDYNTDLVADDLAEIESELDDELSNFESPDVQPEKATLTLIYPHRRIGTLPLTSRVQKLFPTAITSPRIRITFIDAQDNSTFPAWVIREGKYVFGLNEFYRKHKLPIGAYVTLRATDDPLRLIIDFDAHRPHTEYIRLAVPKDGRLTFNSFKRSIGAGYDELLILGAEDLEGVDALWTAARDRRRGIMDIMREVMPELSKLFPQNAVHAKTLYSAVNVLRRCPPGPIFAALVSRPEFEHVGGPYWRFAL